MDIDRMIHSSCIDLQPAEIVPDTFFVAGAHSEAPAYGAGATSAASVKTRELTGTRLL
jgi:hypothetical protein